MCVCVCFTFFHLKLCIFYVLVGLYLFMQYRARPVLDFKCQHLAKDYSNVVVMRGVLQFSIS